MKASGVCLAKVDELIMLEEIGYDCSLKNKVVVLNKNALPADDSYQFFFCSGGNGANPGPIGRSVFLNSLSDGEPYRFYRSDVIGTAKPEIRLTMQSFSFPSSDHPEQRA